MKSTLFGIALAALSSVAIAADLPVRTEAPAPAPVFVAANNWTGFYVGIVGGYGSGNHRTRYYSVVTGDLLGDHGTADLSGGLIGGTIGYNRQYGSFVVGIEGDLSKSWISGSTSGATSDPCLAYTGSQMTSTGGFCKTDVNWLATARVRAGFSAGQALFYVTGGAAFAEIEATRPFTGLANNWSQTRTGWTIGAGIEFAINANWSAKGEYLYVDLGDRMTYPCPACATNNHKVRVDTHLVRVGINYRFGGSAAPIVAKY